MNKATINIKGMHCRSCEILVEDELLKVKGIEKAQVSEKEGVACVYYQGILDHGEVKKAVRKAGYEIGMKDRLPLFSKRIRDYQELGYAFLVLVLLYLIGNELGLFGLAMKTGGSYGSLPVVFLVGLTAGISTCMALVGGLVLAVSARFSETYTDASPVEKFRPHLLFNAGRIVSFFALGGVMGYAGSLFSLSSTTLGILTILVGAVMLVLGLQLTDIFPRLKGFQITLPKSIANMFGIRDQAQQEYSDKNAFMMGALTFFLPCGFTQAMQLFAISSGSPVTGALTMGVFALGTAPGLLGIGGLTSLIKGAFAKPFFKFAGLVVVALAFFNISNGMNLSGINVNAILTDYQAKQQTVDDPNVTVENGVQIVKMTQDGGGYTPNSFTIRKSMPVKWIVTSTDPYTCASSIISSKLGIRANLKEGENVFEFTPDEAGTIRFTCSMGMYSGTFNVVDEGVGTNETDVTAAQTAVPASADTAPPASCGGAPANSAASGASCSGGACGCGQIPQKKAEVESDDTPPAPAEQSGNVQIIKATYSNGEDVQPTRFTVKAGTPVQFDIEAKDDGFGCMGSIMIPGLYNDAKGFEKGKTTTLSFTPEKPGSYLITCAMGVPRGTLIVE